MQACIYSYPIGRVAIATIVLKTEQPQSYRLSHCSLEPGLIGNNETAGWYASTNRDRSVEPPGETRRRGYACVRTRACEILRPMQNPTERPRVRHSRARAQGYVSASVYAAYAGKDGTFLLERVARFSVFLFSSLFSSLSSLFFFFALALKLVISFIIYRAASLRVRRCSQRVAGIALTPDAAKIASVSFKGRLVDIGTPSG